MISLHCPYCRTKLKIDETKIPPGTRSFNCPQCKKEISMSILDEKLKNEAETVIVSKKPKALGVLTVIVRPDEPSQVFDLKEGINKIGRKAVSSDADIQIPTDDKTMSRSHISIDVQKDEKGGYKHLLSDNNSKNQTLYNSNYIAQGEVVVLRNNDEILIGRTFLRFNND